jgi:valyl-tRNA synthetase
MPAVAADAPLASRWIALRFIATAAQVNLALENYRFDEAAGRIYQFFWSSFCDWYLEIAKINLNFEEATTRPQAQGTLFTLVSVFEASLRLLSPFMPFLTEEIWHTLYDAKPPKKSIALATYPAAREIQTDPAFGDMDFVQTLVQEIRALRKEIGIDEKTSVLIEVAAPTALDIMNVSDLFSRLVNQHETVEIIKRLAKVDRLSVVKSVRQGFPRRSTVYFDVAVIYERTIDVAAERERLTKDIAKYEKGLAAAERQLGNEAFLAKAPAHVVEGLKKQEAETRLLLEKARAALEALPKG